MVMARQPGQLREGDWTLVLVGPGPLAVALEYDEALLQAPRVSAKRWGAEARYMITLAQRSEIPVVDAGFTWQLDDVSVGQAVPEELYEQVADAIALALAAAREEEEEKAAMATEPLDLWNRGGARSCSTCARLCPFEKAAAYAGCSRHVDGESLIGSVFTQGFKTALHGKEVEVALPGGGTLRGIVGIRVTDWLHIKGKGGKTWMIDGGDADKVRISAVDGNGAVPPKPDSPAAGYAGIGPFLPDLFKKYRGRRCEIQCSDGERELGVPTECETTVDLVIEPTDGSPGYSVGVAAIHEDGRLDFEAAGDLSEVRLRHAIGQG